MAICPSSSTRQIKRSYQRPTAVRVRNYVRSKTLEPAVLTLIGAGSQRKGTSVLSSRRIDQIIRATRAADAQIRNSATSTL
jgi:hypothetical protein